MIVGSEFAIGGVVQIDRRFSIVGIIVDQLSIRIRSTIQYLRESKCEYSSVFLRC